MPLLQRALSFCRTLLRSSRLERDLDDELEGVVQALTEKHLRAGLNPIEARRQALLELGGVEQVKEAVRSAWKGSGWRAALFEAKHAWRGIWKNPGFSLAAIATLALGIGANSAIFSVIHAVLIEPLPYREPDRLVFVWSDMTQAGYPRGPLSAPELVDLRDRSTRFHGFGAIWATTTALTGEGDPEQLRIGFVTTDFFPLLGADAAIGRTFTDEDLSGGAPTAILLSDAVWRRRYGADPTLVGRRILVEDRPTTVVGVMPPDFKLLFPSDASVPEDLQAWILFNRNFTQGPRGQMYLRVIGRMHDGVSLDEARGEVAKIGKDIGEQFTEYGSGGRAFTTVGLQDDGVRDVRPALLALFAGVAVLLTISCVNVAALLIARAASRAKEMALRVALGAGRQRLVTQCGIEGVMLAGLGALAGLAAAPSGTALLRAMRPDSLNRIESAQIDLTVLAFTCVTALVVGVIFSLAPLAEVFRISPATALQQGGRGVSGGVQHRIRSFLVVVQIALSVVLLVAAGLLTRTFINLQQLDAGFRAENRLTFRLALPGSRYFNDTVVALNSPFDVVNTFSRTFRGELAALPSVTAVGAISHVPFDNIPNWSTTYLTEMGQDESQARRADSRAISPGLFEAIGAHLVEGRYFTEDDDPKGQLVAIVDETLARRAWPNTSAIGRQLNVDPRVTGRPTTWVTVVGVVRHVRHLSLLEEVREQVYFPVRQQYRNPMAYVVRATSDPALLTGPVREVLARLDPRLPIYDVRPLDTYVHRARATQRFTMWLVAALAVVALALACVGVYSVIAYSVARRRQEFGLRLALGARPLSVVGLVIREGARLALVGLVIGVVAAQLASGFLEGQLFGVTSRDLVSYLVSIPILALAALIACWLPARRATSVSPLEALRSE